MELNSIRYIENENQDDEWRLEDCILGEINLLVGKNATGKTRTLNVVNNLAKLLAGKLGVDRFSETYFFEGHFTHDNKDICYQFTISQGKVITEQLQEGDEILLARHEDGTGNIFAQELNQKMAFKPPANELAIIARRDEIQHPFLEKFYQWSSTLRYFEFGTAMGRKSPGIKGKYLSDKDLDLDNPDYLVEVYTKAEDKYQNTFKSSIITDMEKMGYYLENIQTTPIGLAQSRNGSSHTLEMIAVKEKDIPVPVEQLGISAGMFRAFSLIIQINYALLENSPSCIIIDDIGEGLDYDRSTSLISLLIEKVQNSHVQLIMSTNDRFVMNKVPLEYWILIRRQAKQTKLYTYRNAKEIFDAFSYTGLSNFDLFSSDFLEQYSLP